ncbi:uncharacterized protein [Amphiura filiformis]|uniref:uncharacterized protein n=1 Tax=Amphiura filiformis TaxID=82378 RepID=UPI003B223370
MNAMTTRDSTLLLVLLLFIAAILSPSAAGSPCSGALARQNERCRNNISFFKRMLETGRRGSEETTIDGEKWDQTNDLEENPEDMEDYRYKMQLIWELLKDIEQYKL